VNDRMVPARHYRNGGEPLTLVVQAKTYTRLAGTGSSMSAGERAVAPTIDRTGEDFSGFHKEQSGWVQVLRHCGEPAHQALRRAATAERSPPRRARLISTLQVGFADYRMLPILGR